MCQYSLFSATVLMRQHPDQYMPKYVWRKLLILIKNTFEILQQNFMYREKTKKREGMN